MSEVSTINLEYNIEQQEKIDKEAVKKAKKALYNDFIREPLLKLPYYVGFYLTDTDEKRKLFEDIEEKINNLYEERSTLLLPTILKFEKK